MHIPYRIILAQYLDYMEVGNLEHMFSSVKQRVLNSPVLLPDGVTLKISPKGWVPEQEHETRYPVHSPHSFQTGASFQLFLGREFFYFSMPPDY